MGSIYPANYGAATLEEPCPARGVVGARVGDGRPTLGNRWRPRRSSCDVPRHIKGLQAFRPWVLRSWAYLVLDNLDELVPKLQGFR